RCTRHEHNLPDMSAALHEPMRLGRFGERKCLVHHRLHFTRLDQWPNLGFERTGDLTFLLDRTWAQRRACPGQALDHEHHEVSIDLRSAEPGDLHQTAVDGERADIARNVAAADHIQDHVDALAAGQLLHDGHEVLSLVIDCALSTELLASLGLVFTANRAEDTRAEFTSQLNGGRTDAAGATMNK